MSDCRYALKELVRALPTCEQQVLHVPGPTKPSGEYKACGKTAEYRWQYYDEDQFRCSEHSEGCRLLPWREPLLLALELVDV